MEEACAGWLETAFLVLREGHTVKRRERLCIIESVRVLSIDRSIRCDLQPPRRGIDHVGRDIHYSVRPQVYRQHADQRSGATAQRSTEMHNTCAVDCGGRIGEVSAVSRPTVQ